MTRKTLITLVAGSFLLLGCAESGHYPITGSPVGENDRVQFMTAPEIIR